MALRCLRNEMLTRTDRTARQNKAELRDEWRSVLAGPIYSDGNVVLSSALCRLKCLCYLKTCAAKSARTFTSRTGCVIAISSVISAIINIVLLLCMYACMHLPIHLFINPSFFVHPSIQLTIHPSDHPPIRPSIHLTIHPSDHPSIHPTIHPSVRPSIHPTI